MDISPTAPRFVQLDILAGSAQEFDVIAFRDTFVTVRSVRADKVAYLELILRDGSHHTLELGAADFLRVFRPVSA